MIQGSAASMCGATSAISCSSCSRWFPPVMRNATSSMPDYPLRFRSSTASRLRLAMQQVSGKRCACASRATWRQVRRIASWFPARIVGDPDRQPELRPRRSIHSVSRSIRLSLVT